MRALTEHQPGASFLVSGQRRHVVRSWRPDEEVVGTRIAIHAARRRPRDLDPRVVARLLLDGRRADAADLPYGAVLGTAVLVAIVSSSVAARTTGALDRALTDFTSGGGLETSWAWLLGDPIPFPEPVKAMGAMGLWPWTPPAGLGAAR